MSLLEGKDNFQSRTAKVPVLSEILGEVPFGRTILLLYDPDAQTTSLLVNVSAEYLRAGGDLLYFCSCQPVVELRQRFERLGLEITDYEAKDSAVLFEAYSTQAGTKSNEKYQSATLNLNELSISSAKSAPQWPAGTLVVWESLSNIAFGQENIFAKFSRKMLSTWRPQGTIMIAGFADGLHPPSFYQEMKLISDAVIEIKLEEHEGEIVNTIRARSFKGQNSDTKVRRITFDDQMKATLQLLNA